MERAAEKILGEALELEESDRATLAGLLIESLDGEPDEDREDLPLDAVIEHILP